MADYDIPTLKEEIDRETVEQVWRSTSTNTNTASRPIIGLDVLPVGLERGRPSRFDSLPRRKSQNGCWNGVLTRSAVGETLKRPNWAKGSLPQDRLPGDQLLFRAEELQGPQERSMRSILSFLKTYAKLGIPLKEQAILADVEGAGEPTGTPFGANVAVDAVFELGLGRYDLPC